MVGSTLRVVIADDERPSRRFLANLLLSLPDVEIVGEAADGFEALEVIASTQPDVALLDLLMPGLEGCCVARSLPPQRAPFVVFTTADAKQHCEAEPTPYLLKPVDVRDLQRALDSARSWLGRRAESASMPR
jgi:two-component system LytT family response regulator